MNGTLPAVITAPEFDATFAVKAEALLASAQDYEVDSIEIRRAADEDLARCKQLLSDVEKTRKSQKEPYLDGGRKVDEYYSTPKTFLERAINVLTPAILGFDRAQAAKAAEAQREADRAAASQRATLEAQAAMLEMKGSPEAAESLREAAQFVQAPVIQARPDKADTSTNRRETWAAEVEDIRALCRAIADGLVSTDAVEPNMAYLNGRARLDKAKLAIPGVKAVPIEGLAKARRAA